MFSFFDSTFMNIEIAKTISTIYLNYIYYFIFIPALENIKEI